MSDPTQREIDRYEESLQDVHHIYSEDPTLAAIVKVVVKGAASAAFNAGMGGAHHDGGASASIDKLRMFLQGVAYGDSKDQENLGPYRKLYDQITRENDPKYKEYLRLKEIYGDD